MKSLKSFVFVTFLSSRSLDVSDKLPDFGVLSQTDEMVLQVAFQTASILILVFLCLLMH